MLLFVAFVPSSFLLLLVRHLLLEAMHLFLHGNALIRNVQGSDPDTSTNWRAEQTSEAVYAGVQPRKTTKYSSANGHFRQTCGSEITLEFRVELLF